MPRAGLNREVLLEQAMRLANAEGLAAVGMARLAADAGVKTPSLYKHIDSLEDIQTELAIRGVRGMTGALAAALPAKRSGQNPTRQLEQMARAYRRFARENPGLYAAMQPTDVGRAAELQRATRALLELVFGVLSPLVTKANLVHATRILRAMLHGFVDLELRGGFGLPEDVERSFALLIKHYLAGFAKVKKV